MRCLLSIMSLTLLSIVVRHMNLIELGRTCWADI